ncbi:MAG: hypothetical protein JNL01_12010 [Bdellovibrionales bacterium]|nr:hypothetical protein [Bdellovibrionales bacterium]
MAKSKKSKAKAQSNKQSKSFAKAKKVGSKPVAKALQTQAKAPKSVSKKEKKVVAKPSKTAGKQAVLKSQAVKAAPKAIAVHAVQTASAPAAASVKTAAAAPIAKAKPGRRGRSATKKSNGYGGVILKPLAFKVGPNGEIIYPTDEGNCREMACDGASTTAGYCRMHYIKNWKKIKQKEQILREGKLEGFIAELVAKYPDKYLEAIRNDLAVDREFLKVVADLELDESASEDFESADSENADESLDHLKREFEDEVEAF